MILERKSFTPAPEGDHDAVCVDVVDLGIVDTAFGKKPKLKLVWEIAAFGDDGKQFTVRKLYTASINEKSTFFRDLKTWFGKGPERSFDTDVLLGRPCRVIIEHSEAKDGEVYANVVTVLKPAAGTKLTPSGSYVREKDRDDRRGNTGRREDAEADTSVPF